jgi:hypothetical protein
MEAFLLGAGMAAVAIANMAIMATKIPLIRTPALSSHRPLFINKVLMERAQKSQSLLLGSTLQLVDMVKMQQARELTFGRCYSGGHLPIC